jgi:cation diffusion facilitator family transporter
VVRAKGPEPVRRVRSVTSLLHRCCEHAIVDHVRKHARDRRTRHIAQAEEHADSTIPINRSSTPMRIAETADVGATHRSVLVSFVVNCAETLALGVAAWLTGSVALRAQTAANFADVVVQVFLLIGVLSSVRPPNETHPLGYGRERFFWSLFAALGIAVGGSGFALDEAVRSALHPSAVESYPVAYLVLAVTVMLDALVLPVALRPLRKQAAERHLSLRAHLRRNTDPALTTVAVSGGCAVIGGVLAAAGLVVSQVTGSPTPDTIASALIGLLLLIASVLLLGVTRELLSGRSVPLPMVRQMSGLVAAQPGVVDVPDLFAIVVGPSSLIVNGDVTFDDDLDTPALEQTIMRSAAALRERWPSVKYVYLTPVPTARPRRFVQPSSRAVGGRSNPAQSMSKFAHDAIEWLGERIRPR